MNIMIECKFGGYQGPTTEVRLKLDAIDTAGLPLAEKTLGDALDKQGREPVSQTLARLLSVAIQIEAAADMKERM